MAATSPFEAWVADVVNERRLAPTRIRLWGWLSPAALSAACLALAAGFGQFGAVAALGDVAKTRDPDARD